MKISVQPLSVTQHEQVEASAVWTIVHGGQSYPVVDVYVEHNGDVQKIIPRAVSYVDENTVEISFSEPKSGFATILV